MTGADIARFSAASVTDWFDSAALLTRSGAQKRDP